MVGWLVLGGNARDAGVTLRSHGCPAVGAGKGGGVPQTSPALHRDPPPPPHPPSLHTLPRAPSKGSIIPFPGWNFPAGGGDAPSPGVCPPVAAAATESTLAGISDQVTKKKKKKGSRANSCPPPVSLPREVLRLLFVIDTGENEVEKGNRVCVQAHATPVGTDPRVGIPREELWRDGLGKVSVPFHPCLAHGAAAEGMRLLVFRSRVWGGCS